MDWDKFFSELGATDDFIASVEPFKAEFEKNTSDDFPFFMEEDFYRKYYSLCGRNDTEDVFALMREVADIVRANPCAARYANMMHYAFYQRQEMLSGIKWFEAEKLFGRNVGIFTLLVTLSALPLVRKKHIELGLDESYMHGTARWIGAFVKIYCFAHDGLQGHPLSNIYWLRLSIDARVIRIGRLEYMFGKWDGDMPHLYRNRNNGEIIILCRDKWAFGKDLMRVDPESADVDFTTSLTVENNSVTGTPADSSGYPEKDNIITLDLNDWELLIQDNEEIMTLHIPGDGPLSLEAINSSLREAKKFYKKVFDKDIRIFTCGSWLFNPVWQLELPDSNIAEWQRNSNMLPPYIANGLSGLFFVYGEAECDPRQRKCETSLHRAFCRIFDRGEKLRSGAMYLLAEDLPIE